MGQPRDVGDGERTVLRPLPKLEALRNWRWPGRSNPELGDRRSRYRNDVSLSSNADGTIRPWNIT
ncbi:hypothetical protein ACFPH6_49595 [Streptomyces xiangluensis]|uniref:Uncharacterized protein n=1 Tax=Streptomyces xiangluensis TaxID=2665720 RepID=A0ABV8Z7Y1_9ACTN